MLHFQPGASKVLMHRKPHLQAGQVRTQAHINGSNARFDSFLSRRMDAEWASARHHLLRTTMGAPAALAQPGAAPRTPGLLPAPGRSPGVLIGSGRGSLAPPTASVCVSLDARAHLMHNSAHA